MEHDTTFGCRASSARSARESITLEDLKAEPQRGCPRRGLLNHKNMCRDMLLSLFVSYGCEWLQFTRHSTGYNWRRALRTVIRAPSVRTERVNGSHPTAKSNLERLMRHFATASFHFPRLRLPTKQLPHSLHFAKVVLVGECQMRARMRESSGTTDQMHGVSPSAEVLLKRPYRVSSTKSTIFCVRECVAVALRGR